MSVTFDELRKELMQDPEFQREYEALEPEFEIIRAMVAARTEAGMTQKQLADVTGIAQGDISKLERGNANPSLRTLKRIAADMGMQVHIEFRPIGTDTPFGISAPGLCHLCAAS